MLPPQLFFRFCRQCKLIGPPSTLSAGIRSCCPNNLEWAFSQGGYALQFCGWIRLCMLCPLVRMADQMGSFRYFGWRYAPLSARATELPDGRS
jgi:hypothetical protein